MSTIIEIITKIKEHKSGFKITDDFIIDDNFIFSTMNDIRETLIREEFNQKKILDPQYYQMTCCNEIECVTETCTYNGREVKISKPMYKVNMPLLITKIGESNIKFIGSPTGQKYNRYSYDGFLSTHARLWTPNTLGFTQVGSEMLLNRLITPGMKFICMMVLLKNPSTSCDWNEDESEYPVPSETKLVDMVLYRLRGNARDVLNNAADDLNPPKIEEQELARSQQLSKINQGQPNQ